MEFVNINEGNREQINSFTAEHWFATDMINDNINAIRFYQKRGFDIDDNWL